MKYLYIVLGCVLLTSCFHANEEDVADKNIQQEETQGITAGEPNPNTPEEKETEESTKEVSNEKIEEMREKIKTKSGMTTSTSLDVVEEVEVLENKEMEEVTESIGTQELQQEEVEEVVIIEEVVEEDKVVERIIKIDAQRFHFSQPIIKVKQWEKVTLMINNTDTLHGITIPGMNIKGDNQVVLDTSNTGTFDYRCANYCGHGHGDMTGTIIVE